MRFQRRWIEGKTISSVDMRTHPSDRGGMIHDPVIRFTDGSSIRFVVEEDDVENGVGILYRKGKGDKR